MKTFLTAFRTVLRATHFCTRCGEWADHMTMNCPY